MAWHATTANGVEVSWDLKIQFKMKAAIGASASKKRAATTERINLKKQTRASVIERT